MALATRLVRGLSAVCGVVAALCLAAACVAVCQMVFVRYVLGDATVWQTEFVLYSVVAATLMGSPYVLALKGHVNVDLLGPRLAPSARRWLELLAATFGLAFCVMLAASGGRYFHEAWSEGWVTESVWAPPLWIVLLPLPAGIGVLVLQYVADMIALVGAGPDGSPSPPEQPAQSRSARPESSAPASAGAE